MSNRLEELLDIMAITVAKEEETRAAYQEARQHYEDARAANQSASAQFNEEVERQLKKNMDANRRSL